jgi:hypothetical protein
MLRLVEMLGCVLVLGRVATTNVSATQAQAQVNPRVAGFDTVLTHMLIGFSDFDLIKVGAFFWHRFLLYLLMNVVHVPLFRPLQHRHNNEEQNGDVRG